jgi:hypothetical protein
MPDTRLVYLGDRESDMLVLRQRAHALETPADWLLRWQRHRCFPEGGQLWTKVRSGELGVRVWL